ncbi:hypothetical protein C3941_02845 [Kaistia algarum]|uniref:dual OB domain-containing protein n=1 Tax=Kaistia algarum TaxID=2083279 RepID=UPI000CE8AD88|nr:hypothetical protein [Kaistia algarum]MCX5512851.1 hypothetical protein [Kaistia algarum]PPE81656.1 hypothetical protein C3941_02845 [Kaistia algarum]
MAIYNLCITDVTCYGALYCVAGWDIDDGGMVRPEPPGADPAHEPSRFWDAQYAGPGKIFAVGNIVRFDASGPPNSFPFPHATEDRIVKAGSQLQIVKSLSAAQLVEAAADSVSESLQDVFEGHLVRAHSGKAYVPANIKTNSLGAIEIDPGRITFHEDVTGAGKRRLRAVVDQDGVGYDLSVPADLARTRFLTAGLDALQADANSCDSIHVRVGLCRPFPDIPDACYAQVNGLYFL